MRSQEILFIFVLIWYNVKIVISSENTIDTKVILLGEEISRLRGIDNLLLTYKNIHSRNRLEQISSLELCSKQFILSSISCRDAGNGIGIKFEFSLVVSHIVFFLFTFFCLCLVNSFFTKLLSYYC